MSTDIHPSDTERKIRTFLESWNLRGGELDEKASCAVCGRDLIDGKFAMIDQVLICLGCKDKDGRAQQP